MVHHRSYARDVMEGKNDSMLATVCAGCHDYVHFNDVGATRDEADVDAVFLAGRRHLTEIPASWQDRSAAAGQQLSG